MKERPILMSAPMVRAILDDRKTKTRRILKPQPDSQSTEIINRRWDKKHDWIARFEYRHDPGKYEATNLYACPYGSIGDRLWVRETFCVNADFNPPYEFSTGQWLYRADFGPEPVSWNWKPSIFMPRKASRITLEITGIRVERLNDISEADAIAEGGWWADEDPAWSPTYNDPDSGGNGRCFSFGNEIWDYNPVLAYSKLWESINGDGSWEKNPWVWVIEFKRVDL